MPVLEYAQLALVLLCTSIIIAYHFLAPSSLEIALELELTKSAKNEKLKAKMTMISKMEILEKLREFKFSKASKFMIPKKPYVTKF